MRVFGSTFRVHSPSVKNYRKGSCRDFRLSRRRFLQCGGKFDHFAVGERADEFCDLVDLYRLSRCFPQFGREFYHFAVGKRADEFCDFVDMVQRLESIFTVHFFLSGLFDEFVTCESELATRARMHARTFLFIDGTKCCVFRYPCPQCRLSLPPPLVRPPGRRENIMPRSSSAQLRWRVA